MKKNENGRSMVEMLGVLAVVAVLSVGALLGYSKAVFKQRVNQTVSEIATIVINTQTFFRTQTDYAGLSTQFLEQMNAFPETVHFVDYKPRNAFGGEYEIESDSDNENKTFTLRVSGLPKEAVYALSVYDWSGLDSSRSTIFKVSHRLMDTVYRLVAAKQTKDTKKSFDYASLFVPYAYAGTVAGTAPSTAAPSVPSTAGPYLYYSGGGNYGLYLDGNWGTVLGPVLPYSYDYTTLATGDDARSWYNAYYNQLSNFTDTSTGAFAFGTGINDGVVTYRNGVVTSMGTGYVSNGNAHYTTFSYVIGSYVSPYQYWYGSVFSNDLYDSYYATFDPLNTPSGTTRPSSGTSGRPGSSSIPMTVAPYIAIGVGSGSVPAYSIGSRLIDGENGLVYAYYSTGCPGGSCLYDENGNELEYVQMTRMGTVNPYTYCRQNPSGLGCTGGWVNYAYCGSAEPGCIEVTPGTYDRDPQYCQSFTPPTSGTAPYPCTYENAPADDFCAQHRAGSGSWCYVLSELPVWGYQRKRNEVNCSFDSFPIEIGELTACVKSKEEENNGLYTLSITVQ